MSWLSKLQVIQNITLSKSIRYREEDGGHRFFYVSNGYLVYTARYDTLADGVTMFMQDFEKRKIPDADECPSCGRSIEGRKSGSVYCSSRCSRRAEARRRKRREMDALKSA